MIIGTEFRSEMVRETVVMRSGMKIEQKRSRNPEKSAQSKITLKCHKNKYMERERVELNVCLQLPAEMIPFNTFNLGVVLRSDLEVCLL